jgi:PQ loop repeat
LIKKTVPGQAKSANPNLYQKWSISHALLIVCPIAIVMGGVQGALIVSLRIAKERSVGWPLTMMAVLSALFLALGVLRHYWDIWIHRTVRGISFIFVAIDAAGDLFSLVSIFFQPTLDIKGMVIYGTELVLWLGVFACGGYFNFLPWIRKKRYRPSPRPSMRSNAGDNTGDGGQCIQGIAMHDLPSSTSVFRTPSSEISVARARNVPAKKQDAQNHDSNSADHEGNVEEI